MSVLIVSCTLVSCDVVLCNFVSTQNSLSRSIMWMGTLSLTNPNGFIQGIRCIKSYGRSKNHVWSKLTKMIWFSLCKATQCSSLSGLHVWLPWSVAVVYQGEYALKEVKCEYSLIREVDSGACVHIESLPMRFSMSNCLWLVCAVWDKK